jgi:multiple sugar transport system ATP-binding protein
VVLSQGRIQQIGTPQDIYQHPTNRMVATFLGSPPMNLFHATYREEVFHFKNQTLPCPDRLKVKLRDMQGKTVDLGIRPEAIQVIPELAAGHITVTVDVVEPLGRENLIRASLLGEIEQPLNLITEGSLLPHASDRLTLKFDLDQLRVFDAINGELLG